MKVFKRQRGFASARRRRDGFTLIELLVVISVISLLSSVVFASLNSARAKARDARRMSDLHQIVIALESYYADNGTYPPVPATGPCGAPYNGLNCNGYYTYSSWNTLATVLAPYLTLPRDPINSGCTPWDITDNCYSYAYGNVGTGTGGTSYQLGYDLVMQLENKSSPYRCEIKDYRFNSTGTPSWCGSYSDYLYDAGRN